jgi:hypothetical protein
MGRYYDVLGSDGSTQLQLTGAGTGCSDGFCLWLTGQNIPADAVLLTEDPSGNVLGTYSGGALVLNLGANPQVATVALASDAEKQMLVSQGLTVVLQDPDDETEDSYSVSFPNKIQVASAVLRTNDPPTITVFGSNLNSGTVVAVRDSQWNYITTYSSGLIFDLATTPQMITFTLTGAPEINALYSGGLIVTAVNNSYGDWDSSAVTQP